MVIQTPHETPNEKVVRTFSLPSLENPNLVVHSDLASLAAGRTKFFTFKHPNILSMQENRDRK